VAVVIGEAAVRLRPETSTFKGEAEGEIDSAIPGVAKKAAGYFVAAFAAVKIGEFLKGSIEAASDLSESTSKVGVVFGSASQQVLDFAANSSTAFGQTKGQALEAAGTFGNLLRSLGLSEKASADMSTSFVGLASDLASFNNTDPAEALEALRSGLTGETEPLKRYGINLNDATLKQEALRLGLDASGSTLSAATKAQAAYSLIMQQSSLAQGDFARTSSGLANQQRIMSAQFTDLQANIGGLFVPVLGNAATVITGRLMPGLLNLTSGLSDVGSTLGAFGDYVRAGFNQEDITGLYEATGSLGTRLVDLGVNAGVAGGIFSEAFADGKAGADLLAADGLGGLAARAGVAAHHVRQEFGVAFSSIAAEVGPQLSPLQTAFASTWASARASAAVAFAGIGGTIGDALGGGGGGGILSNIASKLGGAMQAAVPVISGVLTNVLGVVQSFLPVIGDVFATIGPVVVNLFQTLGPAIAQILPVIVQVAGIWREVFLGAFEALLPIIPTIVGTLGQLVTTLAGALVPLLTTLAPVISQVATAFQDGLISIIQALVPVIPPLVDALSQVVSILAGAFLSILTALAPVIPVIVDVIGQLAQILAEGLGQALQAIVPILPQIAQLLGDVATMLAGALGSALQAILPILPPLVDALVQIATTLIGVLMSALSAIMPIIPQLIDVFVQLVNAALVPILPILPILANLLATIISAISPIIPVVVQVVALLIQLALAAIMPLMPILTIAANLFAMLISAIVPIIQVVVTVIGAILGFIGTIIGAVVGFVSMIVGAFTGLIGAISSIFGAIFSVVSGIWNSIFGFISGIVSKIAGTIGGIFRGIGDTIGGIFSSIGDAISNVFQGAVDVVKKVINTIIGAINWAIDFINSKLIDTANKVPFVNIPHIPHIPTLHEGGYFDSQDPNGQGLALLRDRELVATPEQQAVANDFLAQLLHGRLPGQDTTPAATATAGQSVQVVNNVTQQPGEDGSVLAARVTQGVVWNLNAGITRRVGVAAEATP
jgi:phage-related protein